MNLGVRTYTPFVTLMDMPVLLYMRYERAFVQQLERMEEEKNT